MNPALAISAKATRIHLQRQRVCSLQREVHCPAQASAATGGVRQPSRLHALVLSMMNHPVVLPQPGFNALQRSVQAMLHGAEVQERLICEAETALARQSVRTYRQWYTYWRHRGVRVNDLLDTTRVWRQRATAD